MTNRDPSNLFDFVVVGAGISGSFIAHELCRSGARCLMLEAGRHFRRDAYPTNELDGAAQLYWGGGVELGHDAKIVFLRPKVVGGGSVVNQALVDRFDEDAFTAWRQASGVAFFNSQDMAMWYDQAESEIAIQTIAAEHRNRNATIFQEGFEKRGYRLAPLRRAQSDCHHEEGNCCIECLNGCRIGSKQSTPETVLKKALEQGLVLEDRVEVTRLEMGDTVRIHARDRHGGSVVYRSRRLVLAAGSVGNTKLLLAAGLARRLPAIGRHFYCHPQYNVFGIYDEPVNAHRGPLQAFKSDEPEFRRQGFKLENVFAGPAAVAMLIRGFGRRHQRIMEGISHMACIEVCTRDTRPGRIRVGRNGRVLIHKPLNREDRSRRDRGLAVIRDLFQATGARRIIPGAFGIGLHLMGGCRIGVDPTTSVVDPEFRLHGHRRVWIADSSVFPNAPGINPSLTIMALSKKAAALITKGK